MNGKIYALKTMLVYPFDYLKSDYLRTLGFYVCRDVFLHSVFCLKVFVGCQSPMRNNMDRNLLIKTIVEYKIMFLFPLIFFVSAVIGYVLNYGTYIVLLLTGSIILCIFAFCILMDYKNKNFQS